MKHLFIVNPTAGSKDRSEEVRSMVEQAFRSREDSFEIYVTKAPMDATAKIQAEAASGQHIRVYACGGDGTFNECVCGAAMLSNVAAAPFPTGTGNDFCRMFGDEQDMYRDLNALLDGFETPIDLIQCNGRYGVNICSAGIDARIGTDVHKSSSLPLIGGAGGYVVSTVVNMFKGITRNMRIKSDDFSTSGKKTLVCVCNGRFYGGGFNPSLDARPDDGILDIYIVNNVSIFKFAALIGKYASGKADELSNVCTHLRTDNVEIEFDDENVVQIDGEAVRGTLISIKLVPNGMNLIVPKGMKFFEKSGEQG